MLDLITENIKIPENKIFILPGNHDHFSLFEEKKSFGLKNLNKNFQKIFNDLYIGGIGGAVPGIFKLNGS